MIYFLPGFPLDEGGHGGNHRSAQIAELLRRIAEVDDTKLPMIWGRRVPSVAAFRALTRVKWRCLRKFAKHVPHALRYADRLLTKSTTNFIATEQYYDNPALAMAAAGIAPLAIFPQNIESLVPHGAKSLHRDSQVDFELEKALLGLSRYCVTICQEDADLLSSNGIDTLTLPYYPARERLERLIALREARTTVEKKHLLILGSVNNPPTKLGVEKLLRGLEDFLGNSRSEPESPVFLAGHGTESFSGMVPAAVKVEGSVSAERLAELQLHAKAMIIYHPKTTGALTRVVESLICGIPILANENAARGHRGLQGLHVAREISEIWDMALGNCDFETPRIPERPEAAEDQVTEALRCISSTCDSPRSN